MMLRWRKYFVLFGVFLLNVPNGVTWYYGNLSSYTACVFRKKQGSNIETPWLMSVEVACWTIGIILGGLLDSRLGPRWTMLLGAVLFNISLFLTYLTFEMTFVTFILALGVLTGIADGVLHSASLSFVVMWVDNYVGLAIGVATSSLGLGAVLINLIITRYINPMNVNPDATDGNLRIFTQPDVLDRVPRVFLILGTFSSVFHFMGFVFLQTRKNHTNSSERSHTLFCSQHLADNGKKSGNFCVGSVSNDNISKHAQVLNKRDAKKSGNFSVGSVSNDNIDRHTQQLNERDHVTVIGEEVDTTVQDANDESDTAHLLPESTPDMGDELRNCSKCNLDTRCGRFEFLTVWKMMMRTKELYALVLLQFSMDYALVVVSHFYKLFGQTWLSDDRSLAILGTVMTLTTIFPKLLLGVLQDKIGLKETWIIMTSGTTITSAFWYFTPRVNNWMFYVWTVCITWFVCAFDSLVVAGVVEVYGSYRCILKYGILALFSTVLQLSAPPVMSEILETFGWLGLFLSVSCLHCLSLIASVLLLPRSDSASKTQSESSPCLAERRADQSRIEECLTENGGPVISRFGDLTCRQSNDSGLSAHDSLIHSSLDEQTHTV